MAQRRERGEQEQAWDEPAWPSIEHAHYDAKALDLAVPESDPSYEAREYQRDLDLERQAMRVLVEHRAKVAEFRRAWRRGEVRTSVGHQDCVRLEREYVKSGKRITVLEAGRASGAEWPVQPMFVRRKRTEWRPWMQPAEWDLDVVGLGDSEGASDDDDATHIRVNDCP